MGQISQWRHLSALFLHNHQLASKKSITQGENKASILNHAFYFSYNINKSQSAFCGITHTAFSVKFVPYLNRLYHFFLKIREYTYQW